MTYIHIDYFLIFFIWNIKTSNIFFKFFQVDPSQPVWPESRLLSRVNPWAGFDNYGCNKNINLKNAIKKIKWRDWLKNKNWKNVKNLFLFCSGSLF
jgi:hypothetical protein